MAGNNIGTEPKHFGFALHIVVVIARDKLWLKSDAKRNKAVTER
jgi:hypothetical protein